MTNSDLQGLTAVVTRPLPAGEILCNKIRAAGGHALLLPTIEILPPKNPGLLQQQVEALYHFDWLVFISPQAVYQSAGLVHQCWPILPPQLKVAAIGQSTAQALKEANLPVDLCPEKDWRSEGLADLLPLQHLEGKKIALLGGEDGRPWLADTLTARGAVVVSLVAYQRGLPQAGLQSFRECFPHQRVDIIICTSNVIIKHLKLLLSTKGWFEACQIPMLVISERMQAFASQQGIKKILLALNASHDAIMTVLWQEKDNLCQILSQKKR